MAEKIPGAMSPEQTDFGHARYSLRIAKKTIAFSTPVRVQDCQENNSSGTPTRPIGPNRVNIGPIGPPMKIAILFSFFRPMEK